jgi:hypothetical protein
VQQQRALNPRDLAARRELLPVGRPHAGLAVIAEGVPDLGRRHLGEIVTALAAKPAGGFGWTKPESHAGCCFPASLQDDLCAASSDEASLFWAKDGRE